MGRHQPYGVSAHGEVIDLFDTLAEAEEAAEIWRSLGVDAVVLTIPRIKKPAPWKHVWLRAWGEVKSVGEWAKDPRCLISDGALRARLRTGKSPEEAIGLPRTPPERRTRPRGWGAEIVIFGESQTIVEWGKDPRCEVSPGAFRGRLAKGMAPEDALRRNRFGPGGVLRGPPPMKIVIFGEAKSISDWARDPRCEVSPGAFRERLAAGKPPEDALLLNSRLPRPVRPGRTPMKIVIFGEAKSISDWARDPRCEVGETKFRGRMAAGKAPEDAIRRDCPSVWPALEAFGEKKSLGAWTRDPRCTVSASTLRKLVKEGVSLEAALRWGA